MLNAADAATAGQEVAVLTQTDFVLLVLLLVALFYAGAAVIYRLALGPSSVAKLRTEETRSKRS
jgi:hypothetical protein